MPTRIRRVRFLAVPAAVTMVAALVLPVSNLLGASTAASAATPPPPPTSVLHLDVTSAMKSPANGGPTAGAPVANYKWLIQRDLTGDPNQPSGPIASNDGTLICANNSATCTLSSPSAPFLVGSPSPDAGLVVTGAGLPAAPGATIASVTDAKNVTLNRTAPLTPLNVQGIYLFSVLRPDPCHPITPDTPTPSGNPNFPYAYNPAVGPATTPPTLKMPACNWPSIHNSAHAPIVTQGDQTDWSKTQQLSGKAPGTTTPINAADLPVFNTCTVAAPCKMFVSVTADGYEISGANFTVPMPADAGQPFATVKVGLNPGPLTLGTLKIQVFDDMAPTGGAYASETESGMVGFNAKLTDFTGNPVSQDYYGNPLCTSYQTDPTTGNTLVDKHGNPTVVQLGGTCTSSVGNAFGTLAANIGVAATSLQVTLATAQTSKNLPPVPFVAMVGTEQIQVGAIDANGTHWSSIIRGFNGTTAATHAVGTVIPDPTLSPPESDGIISIPNLAPGRYGTSVMAPDKAWIQTTTLEGAHDFDVWLMGNDSGLDSEMVAGGEPVPFVQFGFARASMVNLVNGIPTADPANPHNGAYASAGCRVLPPYQDAPPPLSGDIGAQLTAAMQPCKGTNLTPRIDPGLDGQAPTPDGSLQADSWQFPQDPTWKSTPTGGITGHIVSMEPYVPGVNGLNGVGGANGQAGLALDNRPIHDAWVALADLTNGDQSVLVAPAKSDGTFNITNVPDGSYSIAFWDWNQDYAFDQYNVTIVGGDIVNEGAVPLLGWFTRIEGHVFIDKNGNGKMDPGEQGVSDFLMQILNRTNNAEEGGQNVATTNDAGFYQFKEAYPLGNNLVLQFFNTKYKTTGVTCQADNDPQQHTTITGAVDLTTLNVIALNGKCDIGVQPYNTDPTVNDNGGIVATAMYHSFRTEYGQEQAFTPPFDTGQPGFRFELWMPRKDLSGKSTYLTCTAALLGDPGCPGGADGSLVRDPVPFPTTDKSGKVNTTEIAVYDSEHYGRPGSNAFSQPGCVPRTADKQPLDYTYQEAIQPGGDCIEAPLQGTAFGFASDGNPVDHMLYDSTKAVPFDPSANTGSYVNGTDPYPGLNTYCNAVNGGVTPIDPTVFPGVTGAQCGPHGIQVVDGNYTLTPPPAVDANGNFTATTPGDYIVHPIAPNDIFGKPMYKFASEATNNTYEGPGWIPQNAQSTVLNWPVIPQPPTTPGPTEPGFSLTPSTGSPSVAAKCVGAQLPINNTNPNGANYVSNPSWVDFWTTAKNDGTTHGGPFEGQLRPKCDSKLIHVQNGQSVAPNFWIYTDVPLATTFQGYAVDDISVSTNRLSTSIGEVAGIPNMPIGVYDWAGRLINKVNSDYNGQYEVMMPSTNTFNCNTVAGPCPGVYRFVGNDPGQPNSPNLNWNPAYRTIAATFQAWPNVYSPSDVAPTKAVVSFEGNGQQLSVPAICAARASEPQVYATSHPYWKSGGGASMNTLTIQGVGFGSSAPSTNNNHDAGVTLRNLDTGAWVATLNVASGNWSDTQISATGFGNIKPGPYQLMIQNAAGLKLVNGVTFHVLGTKNGVTYNPKLYEVGTFRTGILDANGAPVNSNGSAATAIVDNNTTQFNPNADNTFGVPGDGKVKGAVQRSLEASARDWWGDSKRTLESLVVVYPNFQLDATTGRYGGTAWAPLSAYFENIIIHSPVVVQGSGAGGLYKDSTGTTIAVPGAVLNGQFINANTTAPATTNDNIPGNEPYMYDWETLVGITGNGAMMGTGQPFYNSLLEGVGQVVYVVGDKVGGIKGGPWYQRDTKNGFRPSLDGITVMGGDQKGFPQNISEIGGSKAGTPQPNGEPLQVGESFVLAGEVQGGGIFLQAYAQNFQIANNLIQWNSGTYGGAIRSGWPLVDPGEAAADPNAHNDNLHIHNNRIVANGGTNFAGAIGLFRGTDNYRINDNVICGNLSAEYGGGISHFGYSPGGQIDHNKIMLNQAIDEGGGIMVAGEPALNLFTFVPDPSKLSMGAGPVSIQDNYIGDNLGYDDGGGVRFLQAGTAAFDVSNNMISDNVSAHEGGGVAIDDAPNVRLVNDTIANNLSTATAVTSTGQPAPAGLSTAGNSQQVKAFLAETTRLAANPQQAPVTIPQDTTGRNVTNGHATNGSTTITSNNANFAALDVGRPITGTGIPAGTVIASINSATSAVISKAATATTNNGAWTIDGGVDLVACYPTTLTNGTIIPGMSTKVSCDTMAAPPYSRPTIFNDVFWGNLAGTYSSLHSTVVGICLPQNGPNNANPCQLTNGSLTSSPSAPLFDSAPNHWDIGVADGSDGPTALKLAPINSLLNSAQGWAGTGPGDFVGDDTHPHDPNLVQPYLPAVQSDAYRLQPRFRPSTLITMNLPANVLGDYSIQTVSAAAGIGAHAVTAPNGDTVFAPGVDIEGVSRPTSPDSGADQIQSPQQGGEGNAGSPGTRQAPGQRGQFGPVADPLPPGSGGSTGTFLVAAVATQAAGGPAPGPAATPGPAAPAPAPVRAQKAVVVPASPPAGSVANVVQTGSPNEAGNTPVVQVFGSRPAINGVQQVQPTTKVPAQMPGGIKGGAHFTVKAAHHVYRPASKSLWSRLLGLVSSPFVLFLAAAIVGLAVWRRRRRRLPPRPAIGMPDLRDEPSGGATEFKDRPDVERSESDRPLVLAGKGDRS
jgi:hypothetical protein